MSSRGLPVVLPFNRGTIQSADEEADYFPFPASPAARWISGVNLRVHGRVGATPGY